MPEGVRHPPRHLPHLLRAPQAGVSTGLAEQVLRRRTQSLWDRSMERDHLKHWRRHLSGRSCLSSAQLTSGIFPFFLSLSLFLFYYLYP